MQSKVKTEMSTHDTHRYFAPPRTTLPAGNDSGLGLGMGMGMGMGPAPDLLFGDPNAVYASLGGALVSRHDWKDYVYLVEFIRWMEKNGEGKENAWSYFDREVFGNKLTLQALGLDEKYDINELDILMRMQRARTPDMVQDIYAEASDYLPLFESVAFFDAYTHPNLYKLIQVVDFVAYAVVMQYKYKFRRLRPSLIDASLEPVIKVPSHASFPSGHSTQSAAVSAALSHIVDKLDESKIGGDKADRERYKEAKRTLVDRIKSVAEQVKINREFAGVHYPSDSKFGQKLGEEVWKKFRDYVNDASNHTNTDFNINVNIIDHAYADWKGKLFEYFTRGIVTTTYHEIDTRNDAAPGFPGGSSAS